MNSREPEPLHRSSDVSILELGSRDSSVIFSGKYRDVIFGSDVTARPMATVDKSIDPVQSYDLNGLGYRGPEFSSNIDFLFAGCSFTYGLGIPEAGIWGSIIAKQKGLTYNNVSMNGASIPWIVRELFAYFKKYGNPKTLLCLFPGLTRVFLASNPDILKGKDNPVDPGTEDLTGIKSVVSFDIGHLGDMSKRPSYSKKPHSFEDVASIDMVALVAMQNIRMLEQYCNSSGIEFLWSTWDGTFSDIIENQGLYEAYDFSRYVSMEEALWAKKSDPEAEERFYIDQSSRRSCEELHGEKDCKCYIECHEEFRSIYPESFGLGTDNPDFKFHAHSGVHRHIHFASSFMKEMKRD